MADDTKEKILKTAGELFATSGFHGVSIRDIAKQADVNLSAVNYHFKNKDGLFGAILAQAKMLFNSKVKAADDGKTDALTFALRIRQIFADHSDEFRNGFTIFLSGEDHTDLLTRIYTETSEICLPGQSTYIAALHREIPGLGDAAANWASHVILSYLAHEAMFTTTQFYKMACSVAPSKFNEDLKDKLATEMVIAVLSHLKANHKEINAKLLKTD